MPWAATSLLQRFSSLAIASRASARAEHTGNNNSCLRRNGTDESVFSFNAWWTFDVTEDRVLRLFLTIYSFTSACELMMFNRQTSLWMGDVCLTSLFQCENVSLATRAVHVQLATIQHLKHCIAWIWLWQLNNGNSIQQWGPHISLYSFFCVVFASLAQRMLQHVMS